MSSGLDHHRDHEPLDPPRVEEVAADVFAYVQPDGSWWINNTGFVVGRSMTMAVDTCATERRTTAFLEAIQRSGGATPRLLVNTHHHGDHTNGNCLVEGATIIGHERCRHLVRSSGIVRPEGLFEPVDWGDIEPEPPAVTFEDRLNVYVDDLCVELYHFGTAAHTTNDVVAWIPERKVLFSGDLVFNGGTPFVLMGSVAGSLAVLDRIVEFDAEVVVPGHGPPCSLDVVAGVGAYLRWVQETAEEAYPSGATPLDTAPARPRGLRGADRQRTTGRQPAPRLRRVRRGPTRCRHRPGLRFRRHVRLQRQQAAALLGLIRSPTPSTMPADRLPPAPSSPLGSEGLPLFGTYEGTTGAVDWFSGPRRLAPRRRWKRWHYVSVSGPEILLAVAVVHVGWAVSGFAYLFDRNAGRMIADVSVTGVAGRGATVSKEPAGAASSTLRTRRLWVRLVRGEGKWRLEARSPAMTVDATLAEGVAPSLCAVAPVPGGVVDCTHKTPMLSVEGLASAGGQRFDLAGASAAIDHTTGLLAYDTRWRWASASSASLAFNLTEGFTAPYENALWSGGELCALPPVTFSFDAARPELPWRIADDARVVDLEFHAEGVRRARTDLFVARSNYVQPVGVFRGSVAGLAVDDVAGVTEDHVARW